MNPFSARCLLLWKKEHGENDFLISLFSEGHGRITAIAKNAKKSVKRFGGVLELYTLIEAVLKPSRSQGFYVISEASIEDPMDGIRTDFEKTAHAGYWSEIIYCWLEEGHSQDEIFNLFLDVLGKLSDGSVSAESLGIIFQIKLLQLSGLSPDFSTCSSCGKTLEGINDSRFFFDIRAGRLKCGSCHVKNDDGISVVLSRGTINELRWIQKNASSTAFRIRLNKGSIKESRRLLERFLPFHMGKELKSLRLLERIRPDGIRTERIRTDK